MKTELISRLHPLRPQAETLVQKVYGRVYGACPTQFPDLMAVQCNAEGQPVITCGVRYASDGFFSACYLNGSLSRALSEALGRPVQAEKVVEVTTLASGASRLALGLLQDVIAMARRDGRTCGVFTTIRPLAEVLRRAGLPLVWVVDASPTRVPNPEQWGRYYAYQPAVYAVDDKVAPLGAIRCTTATTEDCVHV